MTGPRGSAPGGPALKMLASSLVMDGHASVNIGRRLLVHRRRCRGDDAQRTAPCRGRRRWRGNAAPGALERAGEWYQRAAFGAGPVFLGLISTSRAAQKRSCSRGASGFSVAALAGVIVSVRGRLTPPPERRGAEAVHQPIVKDAFEDPRNWPGTSSTGPVAGIAGAVRSSRRPWPHPRFWRRASCPPQPIEHCGLGVCSRCAAEHGFYAARAATGSSFDEVHDRLPFLVGFGRHERTAAVVNGASSGCSRRLETR